MCGLRQALEAELGGPSDPYSLALAKIPFFRFFWALVEYFGYADPMYKANNWHIYETEILEQNDRQSANENVVNEFVSVNASLDASAHTDNIIINVDEN